MSKTKKRKNQEQLVEPVEAIDLADELTLPVIEPEIVEPEISSQGTLIAHCGTSKITRAELKDLPTPAETRTHKPLSHYQIVQALIETLGFRHITVVRDEYAVSPDAMRMFGVLDLETTFDGCRFSIGIRNSNDKSLRLAMTIGYRVMVCDNLAFRGDFTPVLAKHSRSLELIDTISVGVDRMQRNFEPLKEQVSQWKSTHLEANDARLIIYEAFIEGKLAAPKTLIQSVHKHYFEPEYDEFRSNTFWCLSNAFTSAFKELKPVRQFQITAKLGKFLEQFIPPY